MTISELLQKVPLLLLVWIVILATTSFAGASAPAFLVLFPSGAFERNLPVSASVMGKNRWSLTLSSSALSSSDKGFARELYRSGAFLVLPARLPGCGPVLRSS